MYTCRSCRITGQDPAEFRDTNGRELPADVSAVSPTGEGLGFPEWARFLCAACWNTLSLFP